MPSLFEEFLTVALDQAIVRVHGGAVGRQTRRALDQAGQHKMRADITWLRSGAIRAVVDAKYKPHVVIDDLYQMLAYCTVLGLHHGHLVYVDGVATATHKIQNAEVRITAHVLNLDRAPKDLLADVDALADLIVE